jgi:hypothetical protein
LILKRWFKREYVLEQFGEWLVVEADLAFIEDELGSGGFSYL